MFRKGLFVALVTVAQALLASTAAHAITVTIDNPNQTIVRPTTGFVDVVFTGTIGITDGFELLAGSATSLWNASGDLVAGVFPDLDFGNNGVLFTVRVDSTDLGLYAYQFDLTSLAQFSFAECPIGGGFCNNAGSTYSVNVVDRLPAPEPTVLSLFALTLIGAGVARRRRRAIEA